MDVQWFGQRIRSSKKAGPPMLLIRCQMVTYLDQWVKQISRMYLSPKFVCLFNLPFLPSSLLHNQKSLNCQTRDPQAKQENREAKEE